MTKIFTYIYLLIASNNFPILENSNSDGKKKYTTNFINIPLNLSAKDIRNNIKLQPKFTVVSITDCKDIPIKEINGRFTVVVKSGESYKITAQLDGYYTKEKIQDIDHYQDKDGFTLVIDMEPQPSASLILKALDESSGNNVEATFKITAGDKTYIGKTSKNVPYHKIILTKTDLYTVEVTSNSHKSKRESFLIEIGDSVRSYTRDIRLEKPLTDVKILIVGVDTKKVLKGVSLKITNTTDNLPLFDNFLPEGEAVVKFDSSKRYLFSIEQPGYTSLKLDVKTTNQKELLITMPAESFFSFGAYDRVSGIRLPAKFKISYKDTVQEIQGTTDSDIKFKATEGGIYTVEVSHPKYTTKKLQYNIENLSAGKISHKINLESAVDEYTILVVDGEDKNMIQGADVKIFDDMMQPVPLKVNVKTGEYKLILEKNRDYFQKIEANGYMEKTGTLQRSSGKFISISMEKVFQAVFYSAIDSITKKPIEAKYKLMSLDQKTLIGTSDATKQYKIRLFPQKNYVLEISAIGYKTITENLGFVASKTEKDESKVIELQKDTYTFTFKIIDAQKKEALKNANLSVLNFNTNQPIIATIDKNGFTVNLKIAETYSVTAEAESYENSLQKIYVKALTSISKFDHEIPLFKYDFDKTKLMVKDEENGGFVANANLKVYNSNNEPISIAANLLSTEWLAELKNDELYNVEIKADGYLPYKGSLPKIPLNKTIKLILKKVPTQDVSLAPIDALTKKGIIADFKITTGGELVNGTLLKRGTRMKATFIQDKIYEIELNPRGYKTFKDTLNIADAVNGIITIPLKKETYGFNFKALDSKQKQPIPNVTLKITDEKNQSFMANYAIETQDFQTNLIPDKKYNIELEAPGYVIYTDTVDVTSLASTSDFKREVFMLKKEVEQEVEPKPEFKQEEPKIVEQKPEPITQIEKKIDVIEIAEKSVEQKPESDLKKVEHKDEKTYVDEAKVIVDEDLNAEIIKNIGLGKRFRLSNFYFEKSSSQIEPKSLPQLDKLFNILQLNPNIKLEIIGYTDNNGDPRLNLALSHFRATVISNYLFNRGTAANRIKVTGKGQEGPIAPNDTEDNRIKNRRVEFVFFEN
jgi:outer membrane protein OmpA-like peptidoglycan-associated protein